jgi:hypothetical protein
MLTSNPFYELSMSISPSIMQGYVILMVLLVIGGTLLDMMHKQSARYFFENAKRAQKNAKRTLSSGEKASFAMQTVLTRCSPRRSSKGPPAVYHTCSPCTVSSSLLPAPRF